MSRIFVMICKRLLYQKKTRSPPIISTIPKSSNVFRRNFTFKRHFNKPIPSIRSHRHNYPCTRPRIRNFYTKNNAISANFYTKSNPTIFFNCIRKFSNGPESPDNTSTTNTNTLNHSLLGSNLPSTTNTNSSDPTTTNLAQGQSLTESHDTGEHAVLSTFDMFTIGIGPSSSHTVGPMRAAKKFVDRISSEKLTQIAAVKIELYGSLACTGLGHGTDYAILMGLEGNTPEEIEPNYAFQRSKKISRTKKLRIDGHHQIEFIPIHHLIWFMDKVLPHHSNGMRFVAYNNKNMSDESIILTEDYYSVGGGFVTNGNDMVQHNVFRYIEDDSDHTTHHDPDKINKIDEMLDEFDDTPPIIFTNAADLTRLARAHLMTISQVVWENEKFWRTETEIRDQLLKIWNVMNNSIEKGMNTKGLLPGEIQATRRAPFLAKKITEMEKKYTLNENNTNASKDIVSATYDKTNPLDSMVGPHYQDWLYCWAMAVNEENAAGGKVVTAPTNGAAGIIPAVIKYYTKYHRNPTEQGICDMLLTAAAIGMLYKRGASLSAAEVGCQGEVGVAASMAAAALAQVMGGRLSQVESAAEIAMEHSLGLTCDPIGGYVQVPCIERNAIGAAKAVAAARMALLGDGKQIVSLDAVIETMRQTGADMSHKYKETALGGLAVNVPVC